MPKIARARIVVAGGPSEVASRVRACCRADGRSLPEDWVGRADGTGFRVAVNARSWCRTVAVGRFVEVEPGRTEVAVEVHMFAVGKWFGRLWFVACVLGLAWWLVIAASDPSVAVGDPIFGAWGAHMTFMVAFMVLVPGDAVWRHDTRAGTFLDELCAVSSGATPGRVLPTLHAPGRW